MEKLMTPFDISFERLSESSALRDEEIEKTRLNDEISGNEMN